MKSPTIPILGLLATVLAGCQVGPNYHPPSSSNLPASFANVERAAAATNAVSVNPATWWTVFHDPQLDSLIRSATGSNLDVRIAAAQVLEAKALRGVAKSDWMPKFDASGSASRSRGSANAQAGRQARALGGSLVGNQFESGLDMSWEVDVFGGVRRGVEAADAELGASEASRRDVMVSVLSEVGLTYLDLRGAQRQLAVARDNLRLQQDALALATDRLRSGLVSESDAARAGLEVATTRSQIPPLEESCDRAIHRLSVLLGRSPNSLRAELTASSPIPATPPRIPVGLPSDLVRRRPDIQLAERRLAAATARVGQATAELFPKFYLTGAAGLQSIDSSDFFNSGSRFWTLGPSLRWPILNGGRIRQTIRVQNARQEQAALVYEQTVLRSLEEVENALVAFGHEQERHEALIESQSAAARSHQLALDRYRGGLTDFLSVLDAERSLLVSQDSVAQSDRLLGQHLVRLFKALGGGWETPDSAHQFAALPAEQKP